MTREQRDKILKALAEDRNDYARDCDRRIAEEQGKIRGADYMVQRFLDVLRTEIEPQESEDKDTDKKCTYKETGCGSCKRQLDCPIEADTTESEV